MNLDHINNIIITTYLSDNKLSSNTFTRTWTSEHSALFQSSNNTTLKLSNIEYLIKNCSTIASAGDVLQINLSI